jgi:ribonuclease Z
VASFFVAPCDGDNARAVVPFHFSPRYEGRESELLAEMHAAWSSETATREA